MCAHVCDLAKALVSSFERSLNKQNCTNARRLAANGQVTRGHMEAEIEAVERNVETVARLACQEMAHDSRLFAMMRLWRVSWERAQRTARAAGFLKAQCDLEQVCMKGSARAIWLLSCHNGTQGNHIVAFARA